MISSWLLTVVTKPDQTLTFQPFCSSNKATLISYTKPSSFPSTTSYKVWFWKVIQIM